LGNDRLLEQLVLDTESDTSVKYFKVLRILGTFSDYIRASQTDMEDLSAKLRAGFFVSRDDVRLEQVQPIIDYNCDIMVRHHREASAAVLGRLERTTNEVQGLMDGVSALHLQKCESGEHSANEKDNHSSSVCSP
jgi:hypothetical protein